MQTNPSPRPQLPDEAFYRGESARRWGALLLLVGLVWLVFELTSRGSLFGFGLSFVQRSADLPVQSFRAERLVVRGVNDQVTFTRVADATLTVAAVRHGFGWSDAAAQASLDRLDVESTQQGDTLVVEVRRASGIAGFVGPSPYVNLQIGLPDGVVLDVQTVSGEIGATGLRTTGSLTTVSGDIDLRDVSGELQIHTTSGDVQMADLGPGLNVTTVSGDVRLDVARGALRTHTISGDLELWDLYDAQVDVETTSGDVEASGFLLGRINTISGDVALRVANLDDLELIINTVSGDLDLDALHDDQRQQIHSNVEGGAMALTISTTSGDIVVEKEE